MCQIEQYECTTSCEKFLFNYLNLLQVLIYNEKYVQLIGSSAFEEASGNFLPQSLEDNKCVIYGASQKKTKTKIYCNFLLS